VADGVSSKSDTTSAYAMAAAINASTSTHGVTATATNVFTFGNAAAADGDGGTNQTAGDFVAGDFSINGTDIFDSGLTIDDAVALTSSQLIVTAINEKSSTTGVTATNSGSGVITLTAIDGRNIELDFADDGVALTMGLIDDNAAGTGTSGEVVVRGQLSLTSNSASGIQITDAASSNAGGDTASEILGFATAVSETAVGSGTALSVASVATVDSANLVISGVDNALTTVNSIRADLGSYQNRFESVVANLQTTAENLSASRSRIVDADFASETANLTKAQILQQSGIAMLAQANAIPQNVLALLQ
jgi:flagellin